MANIGEITGVLRLRDADFTKNLAHASQQLDKTAKGVGGLSGALSSLGNVVGGVSFLALAKSVLEAGVAMERLENRFTLVAGSLREGEKDFAAVREMTNRLGLDLKSTAEAFTSFMAATKGTALEGAAARQIFESVAKSARAMGLSVDETRGIMRAFEQMVSKGNVQAEELRGQLGERLPGAFNMAARAMGVTTSELNDMLKKGDVLASDLLPALAREMEKTFGKGAESAADSMDAQFKRIGNAAFELKALIVDEMGGPIAKVLEFIVEKLQWWVKNWQIAKREVLQAVGELASNTVREFAKIIDVFADIQSAILKFMQVVDRIANSPLKHFLGLSGLNPEFTGGMVKQIEENVRALKELAAGSKQTADDIREGFQIKAAEAMAEYKRQTDLATEGMETLGTTTTTTAGKSVEDIRKMIDALDKAAKAARAAMPTAPMGELEGETKGLFGGGDVNRSWWERMVDDLKPLPGELRKIKTETKELTDETGSWAQEMSGLVGTIGNVFGAMNSGTGQAIANFAALTAQVLQMVAALQAAGNSSGALAVGIAGMAGAAFSSFGGATGDRGKGKFGGQLSGDHSDTGAAVGSVVGGIIGGIAGAGVFSIPGAMIGSAIGQVIGQVVGSFIKRGADEGLAEIRKVGDQIITTVTKNEGGLGDILGDIGEGIANWFENLEDQLGTKIVDFPFFSLKLRDDMIVVFIDNIRAEFETIEEAMEFAIVSALKHVKFAGGLSENVAAVLEAHVFETLEELEHAVNVALTVDRLGIPDFQLELRDEFEALQKLADEIERLGGSAENVWKRLGELTQSRRDMILGITETEEEKLRREVEAFNAERLRVLDQYNVERAAVEKQLAELQIIAAQGAGLVSQEMISALVAKLAQLDAAIAGVAAEITESDIAGVLKPPKKGGGGRREAREGFEGGLLDTIAQGMGVVDQMLDDYSAQVTKIQEETKKLKGDTDLAAKAIEVLGKVLREDLIQTAADIGSSFGISTFATKLAARQLRMDLDAMAQAMLAAGATMEEVMQALGEANLNIFLNIADQMAQAIGDENLLAELAQMRHQMELHNYRLQIEMLHDMEIISDTQHATLLNLVDRWNKAFEASNLVGIPIGGAGGDTGTGGGGGDVDMGGGFFRRPDGSIYFAGGGPGQPGNPFGGGPAANDNSAMERALSILEAWEDLGGSSFGQELERLNEEFEILLDTFGRSPRVLAAAGLALNDLLERALAPVQEFQEGLLFSEFSPLTLEQQFAEAQARFNELVALGDPADAAEIASMAQLLLGLGEQVLSIGGAGFQDLFFDVNSALTDFSQNAIVNAANQLDVSVDQLEVMRRSEAHQERMAGALERLEQNSGLFQNVVNL